MLGINWIVYDGDVNDDMEWWWDLGLGVCIGARYLKLRIRILEFGIGDWDLGWILGLGNVDLEMEFWRTYWRSDDFLI